MNFRVETFEGTAGDRTGTVYVLTDGAARAEVWPFIGFNCLRWRVPTDTGGGDVFYTAPDWEANPVPTRSGHPVLFPFPNRIRNGRFTAHGRTFELPLNDSAKANAIHGFTPRNAWRVLDAAGGPDEATITGQFRLSVDLPESLPLWPSDCSLTLTYRLSASALRVDAVVENPGDRPLPFGLGYHPYFRLPTAPNASVDELILTSSAGTQWLTENGLPTGQEVPVSGRLNFLAGKPVGSVVLDDLLGGVGAGSPDADGFTSVAAVSHATAPGRVTIDVGPAFRKQVLFTPAHRKAIAVEPYTCLTDAANLGATVMDAGWLELPPGKSVTLSVRYAWHASSLV